MAALYALAAIALVLVVLRARPGAVLAVYAVAVLAIPGPLQVPYTGATYFTFQHVLTMAGLARLLLGRLERSLPPRLAAWTVPQSALLALVVVAVVGGVALAPDAGPLGFAGARVADLLDELGFLTVAIVLARQTSARTVLSACALGLLVGIAIATVEHLTGSSWGRLLFRPFPLGSNVSAAFPLSERAGTLRVRAGTEFALQFAWVVVTFAPALVVAALRVGGRWAAPLAFAAGGLSFLAVYWSFSRSALGALLVVLALTYVLLGRRELVVGTGVVLAVGAVAYAFLPGLQARFAAASGAGSLAVRGQRLAPAFEVASRHPFRGAGLGQLIATGVPTIDQSLLLDYLELGVIGAVALGVVLASALQVSLRVVLRAPRDDRDLAVAAALGVAAFVASAMAYDAAVLLQSNHAFLLVLAAAVCLDSPAAAPAPVRRRVVRAVAAGAAGLLVGTVVFALAPTHAAQRATFTTLSAAQESALTYDPVTSANNLRTTVCESVTTARLAGVDVDCTDRFGAAGEGFLRIQAANEFALARAQRELTDRARASGVLFLRLHPLEAPRTGRDTWAATAPVWMALLALGLTALLRLPGLRRGHAPPPGERGAPASPPAQRRPARVVAPGP